MCNSDCASWLWTLVHKTIGRPIVDWCKSLLCSRAPSANRANQAAPEDKRERSPYSQPCRVLPQWKRGKQCTVRTFSLFLSPCGKTPLPLSHIKPDRDSLIYSSFIKWDHGHISYNNTELNNALKGLLFSPGFQDCFIHGTSSVESVFVRSWWSEKTCPWHWSHILQ